MSTKLKLTRRGENAMVALGVIGFIGIFLLSGFLEANL